MQRVWSHHLSALSLSVTKVVFFFFFYLNFNPLCQVWLLFQVPHRTTWQKYLAFSNAEFNSESIDTNFVKVRQTDEEIAYPFILAPWQFSANLLKTMFSVYLDPSGRVAKFFPVPNEGEKLGETFEKKNKSITPPKLFQEQQQEKHYFITNVE